MRFPNIHRLVTALLEAELASLQQDAGDRAADQRRDWFEAMREQLPTDPLTSLERILAEGRKYGAPRRAGEFRLVWTSKARIQEN